MKNAYLANVSGSVPTPGAAIGSPQNGIPGTQAATKVGAHWFYMVCQELLNVLAMGSVTPDATVYNQVATAIANYVTGAITSALGLTVSFGTNGYFSIAGLWLQWGTHGNSNNTDTVSFPHSFPNACYAVFVGMIGADTTSNVNVQASAWSTTQFTLFAASQERPPNNSTCWFAIGH